MIIRYINIIIIGSIIKYIIYKETIQLIRDIGYDQAFTYKYSKRQQTFAGLHLNDDVPELIKSKRFILF